MKKILLVLLCLYFASAALAAEKPSRAGNAAPSASVKAKAASPSKKSRNPGPSANPELLGKSMQSHVWYVDGVPRGSKGGVWEKGIPLDVLARKRRSAPAPAASTVPTAGVVTKGNELNTQESIDSALEDLSAYEHHPSSAPALDFANKGLHGRVVSEKSSWRNPITEPMRVGEEVVVSRRSVVGAYADVVQSKDLQVTVGPELHIPETDLSNPHTGTKQNEGSSLGVGMQFLWGF